MTDHEFIASVGDAICIILDQLEPLARISVESDLRHDAQLLGQYVEKLAGNMQIAWA